MKIGVALTGCDIGGICVYSLLFKLQKLGFETIHISASGTAAAGALLFACGASESCCRCHADNFISCCKCLDLDSAVAQLSDMVTARKLACVRGLSIHAADIRTGKVLAFTNDFLTDCEGLRTYPLTDAYDAMNCSIGGAQGLAAYHFCGHKTGDYSVRYGQPVYPFGMLGIKRVLSFSFLPEVPEDSYEAMLSQRLASTPSGTAEHHALLFPPWQSVNTAEEYENIAGFSQEFCQKLLLNNL